MSMGFGGRRTDELISRLSEGIEIANRNNIEIIMPVFGGGPDEIEQVTDQWKKKGINIFLCGLDSVFLAQTAASFRSAIQ